MAKAMVVLLFAALLSCTAAAPFISNSAGVALHRPAKEAPGTCKAPASPCTLVSALETSPATTLAATLAVARGGAVIEPETLSAVDEAIDAAVKAGKACVLDFSATWCGPCKMISPVYQLLSEEFKDDVVFIKVDVDVNSETAAKYDVTAMPTFVFISKTGEVVDRLAGANADRLREMVLALPTK